jgi:hypothetical protein
MTPVLAKGVDEPPVSPVGRDVDMSSINQEVEVFSHAGVSAKDAIQAAEQHVGRGNVIDIGFEGDAGSPFYRVKLPRGGRIDRSRESMHEHTAPESQDTFEPIAMKQQLRRSSGYDASVVGCNPPRNGSSIEGIRRWRALIERR